MTDRDLLAALLEEEERLLFASFDYATAWQLGSAMRQAALEGDLPLTLSIRRGGQRLFHAALPGSSGNNDAWLERKCAVVDLFGHERTVTTTSTWLSIWTRSVSPRTVVPFPSCFAARGAWARSRCPGFLNSTTTDSSSRS
jgi:uncharacterized protein (UPF0303 family)